MFRKELYCTKSITSKFAVHRHFSLTLGPKKTLHSKKSLHPMNCLSTGGWGKPTPVMLRQVRALPGNRLTGNNTRVTSCSCQGVRVTRVEAVREEVTWTTTKGAEVGAYSNYSTYSTHERWSVEAFALNIAHHRNLSCTNTKGLSSYHFLFSRIERGQKTVWQFMRRKDLPGPGLTSG